MFRGSSKMLNSSVCTHYNCFVWKNLKGLAAILKVPVTSHFSNKYKSII